METLEKEGEFQREPFRLSEAGTQALLLFGLLAIMVFCTCMVDSHFFRPLSLRSLGRDIAILSLFALGQALVIIGGGIDLSVGSLLAFFGSCAILLINKFPALGFGPVAGLILLLAGAIGLIHGMLICKLELPPFLVTLCSLLFFRGLSRVLTSDSTVAFDADKQPFFASLGQTTWLGIPVSVYFLALTLMPLSLFLHQTVAGRYLFAIGFNAEGARYSGVPVTAVRTFSYMLSAMMTALAAFFETSSVGSITPSTAGIAYEMYGITAAVLGGCALRGGRGSLLGVIIGAAVLRVIRSSVIFLNISTYWTYSVTGLVLLAAVIIDAWVRRRGFRGRKTS